MPRPITRIHRTNYIDKPEAAERDEIVRKVKKDFPPFNASTATKKERAAYFSQMAVESLTKAGKRRAKRGQASTCLCGSQFIDCPLHGRQKVKYQPVEEIWPQVFKKYSPGARSGRVKTKNPARTNLPKAAKYPAPPEETVGYALFDKFGNMDWSTLGPYGVDASVEWGDRMQYTVRITPVVYPIRRPKTRGFHSRPHRKQTARIVNRATNKAARRELKKIEVE